MRRSLRNLMLCAPFVAMTFLTVWRVQCRVPPQPLDEWDVPQLVEQLNRAGVEVQTAPTAENSSLDNSAFLTSTERDWHYLNRLIKDPKRIHEWRGIVYCERVPANSAAKPAPVWREHCLEVGPFFFYGDTELLDRIGTALGQPPLSRPH